MTELLNTPPTFPDYNGDPLGASYLPWLKKGQTVEKISLEVAARACTLTVKQRIAIAKACAAQSGWNTAEYFENFGLNTRDHGQEIIAIAKICATQNGWRAAEYFKNFAFPPNSEIEVEAITAIAAELILHEGWDNLIVFIKACVADRGGGLLDSKALLATLSDLALSLVLLHDSLPPEQQKALLHFQWTLLNTTHLPTNTIAQALTRFDKPPKTLAFIQTLIRNRDYGDAYLDNCLTSLLALYPKAEDLSSEKQRVAIELMNSAFKGFSVRVFQEYLDAKPEQRPSLIEEWCAISAALLQGRPLTPALEQNPLLPDLIWNAYRPVGVSVAEVKQHIRRNRRPDRAPG